MPESKIYLGWSPRFILALPNSSLDSYLTLGDCQTQVWTPAKRIQILIGAALKKNSPACQKPDTHRPPHHNGEKPCLSKSALVVIDIMTRICYLKKKFILSSFLAQSFWRFDLHTFQTVNVFTRIIQGFF